MLALSGVVMSVREGPFHLSSHDWILLSAAWAGNLDSLQLVPAHVRREPCFSFESECVSVKHDSQHIESVVRVCSGGLKSLFAESGGFLPEGVGIMRAIRGEERLP